MLLGRLPYYLGPSLIVANSAEDWFLAALSFLLVEGLVGTSRHILNDLNDVDSDVLRGFAWRRYVTSKNKQWLTNAVCLKLLASFILISSLSFPLFITSAILLGTQLLYDWWVKPFSAVCSVLVIAFGYAIRSISIIVALKERLLDNTSLLVVLLSFIFALYSTLEWRHYESKYLIDRQLLLKPGSELFRFPIMLRICSALRISFSSIVVASTAGGVFLIVVPFFFAFSPLVFIRFGASLSNSAIITIIVAIATNNRLMGSILISFALPWILEFRARIITPRIAYSSFEKINFQS